MLWKNGNWVYIFQIKTTSTLAKTGAFGILITVRKVVKMSNISFRCLEEGGYVLIVYYRFFLILYVLLFKWSYILQKS